MWSSCPGLSPGLSIGSCMARKSVDVCDRCGAEIPQTSELHRNVYLCSFTAEATTIHSQDAGRRRELCEPCRLRFIEVALSFFEGKEGVN